MKIPLLIVAMLGAALSALAMAASTPPAQQSKELRQTPFVLGEASSKAPPFVAKDQKPGKPSGSNPPASAGAGETPVIEPLVATNAEDGSVVVTHGDTPPRKQEARQ